MKKKILFLAFMLISMSGFAHTVQTFWELRDDGTIRFWLEHWHNDVTDSSLGNFYIIVDQGNGNETISGSGYVNNTPFSSLPIQGTPNNRVQCSGNANTYNDWVYYDFYPAKCNESITIKFVEGPPAETQEACSDGLFGYSITKTFYDKSAPSISATDLDVNTNSENCEYVAGSFSNVLVADNCDANPTVTYSVAGNPIDPQTFTFPLGTTSVTVEATDHTGYPSNFSSRATFNVIVSDNQAPSFTSFPVDIIVNADPGKCGAVVTYNSPQATDNCDSDPIISFKSGLTSGSTFPVGKTVIIYEVSDGTNVTNQSFTVTVNDNQPPQLFLQNLTRKLTTINGLTVAATDFITSASDNCSYTISPANFTFDCADVGTRQIAITVEDDSGNKTIKNASITIEDPDPLVEPSPGNTIIAIPETYTIIDENLSIHLSENANGATVSINDNFQQGDELRLLPGFNLPSGVNSSYSASTGVLTISGAMTAQELQSIFQNTQFSTTNNDGLQRQIIFNIGGGVSNSDNNHYYEYVNGTFTWEQAKQAASNRTLNGLQGYLATSTSASENEFIRAKLSGDGWIGGSDYYAEINSAVGNTLFNDQTEAEGNWYWVTGPEAGTQISEGAIAVNGQYENWNASEPNNSGNIEHYVQIYFQNEGRWNDLPRTSTMGYIVEYGGLSGDASCFQYSGVKALELNEPPQISEIADIENCPSEAYTFKVDITDTEDTYQTLVVKATSDNQTFIPDDNISIVHNGTNYDVTIISVEDVQGTSDITITATDSRGATSNENFNFTALDNVAPVAKTQNITVQLDANGAASITATQIDNGSSDACGIDNMTLDVTDFDCSNVGANTVTLTVTDKNGNKSTETATVNVEDNVVPIIKTQDITVELDENGAASITPAQIDNGSTDSCGIDSMALDVTDFDCSNVGVNTVTLTVSDKYGNKSTETAIVTVENYKPVLVCPSNIEIGNTPGSCGRIVNYDMNNLLVNADASNGLTGWTVSANDGSGWAASGSSFRTSYNSCDGNSIANSKYQEIDLMALGYSASQLDAAPEISVGEMVQSAFLNACGGMTDARDNYYVKFELRDENHNPIAVYNSGTPSAPQRVGLDPVTESKVFSGYGQGVRYIYFEDGGSDRGYWSGHYGAIFFNSHVKIDTDNIIQTAGLPSGSAFPVGTTTNVFEITDACGNKTKCSFDVIVKDIENPHTKTQDITVQLDENGSASITAAQVDNGSADACGIDSMTLDVTDFDCSNIGPNTVTLTVTDKHGNASTETATVTVEDNIAPVAKAQNITVQLDDNGAASITAAQIDKGSSDACGIDKMSLDVTDFDCSNVGPNTVTLTVTDKNGNKSTETATVTVEDNIAPVSKTQDITVQLDVNGSTSITAAQIDNGSSDACGIDSMNLDVYDFNCSNVGANTVTLAVMDKNGNKSTETATVTVEDKVAPLAVAKDITIQLDENGAASITPEMIDNNSSDACGIVDLRLDTTEFSCSSVGKNTVTLTVEDKNGNKSTETATVTVEDNVAPVAKAQNITVQLDDNGAASITAAQIDKGSSDACGIDKMSLDVTDFDCSNVGPNTVTLTVTDKNGNKSTETATVTVEDKVAPVAVAKDITIQLDASGAASITPEMIDNNSSDACGIADLRLDITEFSCSNVGKNTVELTVEDKNGNISEATGTVTVEDNVKPVASSKNITVQLDENGVATITPEMIDNNSSDACGIADLRLDATEFSCSNVGKNTVTLTVEDKNGNISGTTATVTLEDNVKPVASSKNITVELDENGAATITPEMIDNNSSDACGIADLRLDVTDFSCSNVGKNTVKLTVEDKNGNISEATAVVTVEDNVAPVAAAQDITVQLDENGTASITPEMIDNNSSDACGIADLRLDVTDFSCSDVGDNTVTLTVEDNNGNISETTAVVTVKDNVAPALLVKDITVQLDENGIVSITPEMIDNGSSDACGIASISLDKTTFNCAEIGGNVVTFMVTDKNGNTSNAEAFVTVEDVIDPVAEISQLPVINAECSVVLEDLNVPVATDECAGEILATIDENIFPISGSGSHTITWIYDDGNGNTLTQDQEIVIKDNTAPVPDVAQLDDIVVQCEISDIAVPTATDNCGGEIVATTNDPLSYNAQGEYTITWIYDDSNGNVVTQDQKVIVADTTAPVIVTRDIIVYRDPLENVSITPEDIDGGTYDNCSEVSLSISQDYFTETGDYVVTLTATDAYGNTSQATATVKVEIGGIETNEFHVVPTILKRSSITRVVAPLRAKIIEVQLLETETNKYKVFPGNQRNEMEIDVAPFKGTLLVRIIDEEGQVHLKKIIAF